MPIEFETEDLNLKGLVPKMPSVDSLDEKITVAERGYAVGKIYYPALEADPISGAAAVDEKVGRIIYVKTTIVEGLPLDVYVYRHQNPTFPDESTADQFFSEGQFEAYRALGRFIGGSVPNGDELHRIETASP